jgi:hypothetical protein
MVALDESSRVAGCPALSIPGLDRAELGLAAGDDAWENALDGMFVGGGGPPDELADEAQPVTARMASAIKVGVRLVITLFPPLFP